MGAESKIQWTHHTFNPWRGCTHVSPGCTNCYAEALSKRNPAQLGTWGAGGSRVVAADAYWRQPKKWDRAAAQAGERHRVFCASLADVFEDRPELVEPRDRLFHLIYDTPHLDWLLLTKRPAEAREFLTGFYDRSEEAESAGYYGAAAQPWPPAPNLWLGTTVEDQRRADERIPVLLDTPAAVRFLSMEPLLEEVTFRWRPWIGLSREHKTGHLDALREIDWLIVGGESGPGARPFDLGWARQVVAQGRGAGVPVFVKQLGARPVAPLGSTWELGDVSHHHIRMEADHEALVLEDRKGGDPDEWPADLRVREFPRSPAGVAS